jgi:glycosyltransferase involved in cell wall biosynthesis
VDNPYPYMARASMVALSSEYEGLPTVVIESLAVGTPVVSTDCPGGAREILRNGALGALVPIGDVDAMAEAMTAALAGGRIAPPWSALETYMPTTVLGRYQHVLGLHAQAF